MQSYDEGLDGQNFTDQFLDRVGAKEDYFAPNWT